MSHEGLGSDMRRSGNFQMQMYFGTQLQDWNPFGHTRRMKLALLDPPLTEVCHL